MTAESLIKDLGLEPLPLEGGFFRRNYYTEYGTAIYYLMTPGNESYFHRLSYDEIWHYYAGDPAEQIQLLPDGGVKLLEIGPDIQSGAQFQLVSPGGAWQATRLKSGGEWGLFGTTMSPPYSDEDYEHGDPAALATDYPDYADMIREFICR